MTIQERFFTVVDFESFIAQPENEERLFELINGEIVEKVPTREHGIITGNAVTEINIYLRQNPIGRAAVEARHRPGDDEKNDRLPDVSFVSDLNRPVEREGAALYMPDLAIEVQSPRDSLKSMLKKADFYLENGSKMAWLIYPEKRLVEVFTLDDRYILKEEDLLEGGDVLPGFSIPVSALFRSLKS
jgi:Uma2 family endonuclease